MCWTWCVCARARACRDGSLSIPNAWNGIAEPVVVMTAVPGSNPAAPGKRYSTQMAVVRPTDPTDPFLLSWTKDANNPINFTSGKLTTPYDTPGQVWKNGDHWNFLILGQRYTTKDPSFHTWGLATPPQFIKAGENGGQWFSHLANLKDGSAPPADAPGWMMNVGGGNIYDLGSYDEANENWTTIVKRVNIDHGPDTNWEGGQFAGDRFMNIGWSLGGPPMMVDEYPHEQSFGYTQLPRSVADSSDATGCMYSTTWEVFPGYTNIYDREPSPTNATHGTLKFVGIFDTADACFAAVNATSAKDGPFHSWTYNDDTTKSANYAKHCWADTSMTWQGRGGAADQVSGRGPGFPITNPLPPTNRFTHDHLAGLREVAYDPALKTLVSNPVRELVNLRNGTLGSEKDVSVAPGKAHVVAGTGSPADASTSDVVVNVTIPAGAGAAGTAVGVSVLANVTDGSPFGGVLTVVNFTAPDPATGTMNAVASIRTLNPCGSSSAGLVSAIFPILKGETVLDIRIMVDRSIVEVFVMGGRAVFTKSYNPAVFYIPDTNVAVQAWGAAALTASVDVFSMGCGWTNPPYQPHPTLETIMDF